ncbi:T9SS type A sorting domain-containing protein, partial [bacterium]|nr:T9SS type A sorting domain-containing protein [bacterium]
DVEEGVTYWYAVSAVDSAFANKESQLSGMVSAKPNKNPHVEDVQFVPDDKIKVIFSEPMSKSVLDEGNYTVIPVDVSVSSAVFSKSGHEVLLTVEPPFYESGEYILEFSTRIKDMDNTSLGFHSVLEKFNVEFESNPPYLKEVETEGNYITLTYSVPMDESTTLVKENYVIEPVLEIDEVLSGGESADKVMIKLKTDVPAGYFGRTFTVTAKNVKSAEGIEITEGTGNTISLYLLPQDLSNVFVYPNPYKAVNGNGYVTFANLTENAKIRIADISGRLLNTIEVTGGNGSINWYLDKDDGQKVPSGIYIYYVEGNNSSKKGKLAVIR